MWSFRIHLQHPGYRSFQLGGGFKSKWSQNESGKTFPVFFAHSFRLHFHFEYSPVQVMNLGNFDTWFILSIIFLEFYLLFLCGLGHSGQQRRGKFQISWSKMMNQVQSPGFCFTAVWSIGTTRSALQNNALGSILRLKWTWSLPSLIKDRLLKSSYVISTFPDELAIKKQVCRDERVITCNHLLTWWVSSHETYLWIWTCSHL